MFWFFFSSRRRHTRSGRVTGVQDVCSSDLLLERSGFDPRISKSIVPIPLLPPVKQIQAERVNLKPTQNCCLQAFQQSSDFNQLSRTVQFILCQQILYSVSSSRCVQQEAAGLNEITEEQQLLYTAQTGNSAHSNAVTKNTQILK